MNATLKPHRATILSLLTHVQESGKASRSDMFQYLRSTTPMSTKNVNNLINDLMADGAFTVAWR
jgi:hypothetical protein